MSASTQWQLDLGAAESYLNVLEPSILGPVAERLVSHVELTEGEHVLDVGCGTGAAALAASRDVGRSGRVVGVDINAGMLTVARSRPSDVSVEWLEGSALELPTPGGEFDVAVCAQTLQFIPDRQTAVSEMRRALKPGGRVGVSLWCEVERSPYFHALVQAISTNIGPDTATGLGAAFGLADKGAIERLLVEAGFEDVRVVATQIDIDLPPVREFVPEHVAATPMSAGWSAATPEARGGVLRQMEDRIVAFRSKGGVRVPFWSYFATAVH